jgi:hypothetical protein
MAAAGFGFPGAAPLTTGRDPTSLANLLVQATAISAKVTQRVANIMQNSTLYDSTKNVLKITQPPATLNAVQTTAQAIFGSSFFVLPVVTPTPAGGSVDDPVTDAVNNLATGIAAWAAGGPGGGHTAAAGVLQQLTHLRPPLTRLDEVMTLSATLTGAPVADLAVAQLGGPVPYNAANPWLGQGPVTARFPWTVSSAGTTQSLRGSYALLVWTPTALGAPTGASMAGLFFDEWIEQIPNDQEKTAVAFHYAEPGARAPQSCLLAVIPTTVEYWSATVLYNIVMEAVALAKIRTVDPQTLERGGQVGQFLPALFSAFGPGTISSFIPYMPTSTDGIGS